MKLLNLIRVLLNEVSMEMLKQQFVDTDRISSKDFKEIENIVGTNSAYATWLVSKVDKKLIKSEDLSKFKTYLDIFSRHKKKYPHADINQYKTKEQIADFIDKSVEIRDEETKDPSKQKGISKDDKYSNVRIGEVEGFAVYKLPKGSKDLYNTSCELGSGTEWCTASGKIPTHFNNYINQDDLYIFIKGKEKYQFSYKANQFMDKNDIDVIEKYFIRKNSKTATAQLLSKFFLFLRDKEKRPVPLAVDLVADPKKYEGRRILSGILDIIKPASKIADNMVVVPNFYIRLQGDSPDQIPKNLTVGGDLGIHGDVPQNIPDDLKVGGAISLDEMPLSYPEDLEEKISVNSTTLKQLKAYNTLKFVEISVDGRKIYRRRGIKAPYAQADSFFKHDKELNLVDEGDEDIDEFREYLSAMTKRLNIKWKELSSFYEKSNWGIEGIRVAVGVTEKNKGIAFELKPNRHPILQTKTKTLRVTSLDNPRRLENLSDVKLNKILSALFPEDYKEISTNKNVALLPPKELKRVSLNIPGTKMERGGLGVIKSYDQGLKYVPSTTSQANLDSVARALGIEWDKILIYRKDSEYSSKGYETLFTVISKPKQGVIITYDRGGLGPGGYSKVISSAGHKVNASQVIGGYSKFEDLK